MATWSIVLTDQFKASNGSSADNVDERNDLERFKVQMDQWGGALSSIKDPYMAKAWASNFHGLRTHVTASSRGDHLFRVRQSTTDVTYLMGKLSVSRWGMDLSEVISSTQHEEDLARFAAEVSKEARENPYQTAQSIGAMKARIESTAKDIESSMPLMCLFTWASYNARKVTLTANTVGLIALYEKYGFVLVAPNVVTQRAREAVEKSKTELQTAVDKDKAKAAYNDAKFAVVNALMELSEGGKSWLQGHCRIFVDYMGPSLLAT